MSRGDSSIDVSASQARTGTEEGLELQSLIRDGYSFSARERHCCFLNAGRAGFADVSAISGLDLPDDGRSAALVDWDQDGDLDLWIGNRNGPQVRFLRNDVPNSYHYVSVRLVGRTCNRDAIGARLEVTLDGPSPATLIRTLRAGDGFLAQSSKWLHVGLGRATRIGRVVVRWPGSEAETFQGLTVDQPYVLVQGSGRAELFPGPERHVALQPARLTEPTGEDRARILLASPVPLPRLTYTTYDDKPIALVPDARRPVLVHLWASWCQPCIAELAELAAHHEQVAQSGLNLVALSVDELGNDAQSDSRAAQELVARLAFPFAAGKAPVDLVDKLQILHDQLFDRHTPLPVPTSVLINSDGQLAAVYKGPVSVDAFLADVAKLNLDADQLRQASFVFPGRILAPPARIHLVPVFRELLRYGYRDDAVDYMVRNRDRFPPEIASPDLLVQEGLQLAERGSTAAALERFHQALMMDPRHVTALVHRGRLDEEGGKLSEAEQAFRHAIEIDPESAAAHFSLALLLQNTGRSASAIGHFQKVAQLRPDHVPTLYHLAQILATDPDVKVRDGDQALEWAKRAAEATSYGQAEIVAVLAAAYAEAGQLSEAIPTARRAIELARTAGKLQLANQLEQRLTEYQTAEGR